MTISHAPTDSQRKRAELHLSRRARWALVRNKQTGVEFVIVPSSDGQRAYYVRKDGAGCSCDAYQKYNYQVCSHMLSVRMANEQDAAPAAVEPSKPAGRPAVKTFTKYADLVGQCLARGCYDDRVKHEAFCAAHLTVDAF